MFNSRRVMFKIMAIVLFGFMQCAIHATSKSPDELSNKLTQVQAKLAKLHGNLKLLATSVGVLKGQLAPAPELEAEEEIEEVFQDAELPPTPDQVLQGQIRDCLNNITETGFTEEEAHGLLPTLNALIATIEAYPDTNTLPEELKTGLSKIRVAQMVYAYSISGLGGGAVTRQVLDKIEAQNSINAAHEAIANFKVIDADADFQSKMLILYNTLVSYFYKKNNFESIKDAIMQEIEQARMTFEQENQKRAAAEVAEQKDAADRAAKAKAAQDRSARITAAKNKGPEALFDMLVNEPIRDKSAADVFNQAAVEVLSLGAKIDDNKIKLATTAQLFDLYASSGMLSPFADKLIQYTQSVLEQKLHAINDDSITSNVVFCSRLKESYNIRALITIKDIQTPLQKIKETIVSVLKNNVLVVIQAAAKPGASIDQVELNYARAIDVVIEMAAYKKQWLGSFSWLEKKQTNDLQATIDALGAIRDSEHIKTLEVAYKIQANPKQKASFDSIKKEIMPLIQGKIVALIKDNINALTKRAETLSKDIQLTQAMQGSLAQKNIEPKDLTEKNMIDGFIHVEKSKKYAENLAAIRTLNNQYQTEAQDKKIQQSSLNFTQIDGVIKEITKTNFQVVTKSIAKAAVSFSQRYIKKLKDDFETAMRNSDLVKAISQLNTPADREAASNAIAAIEVLIVELKRANGIVEEKSDVVQDIENIGRTKLAQAINELNTLAEGQQKQMEQYKGLVMAPKPAQPQN